MTLVAPSLNMFLSLSPVRARILFAFFHCYIPSAKQCQPHTASAHKILEYTHEWMSGVFPTHWKMETKLQKIEDWGICETRQSLQGPGHRDVERHKWDDPGPHQAKEEGCFTSHNMWEPRNYQHLAIFDSWLKRHWGVAQTDQKEILLILTVTFIFLQIDLFKFSNSLF